MENGIYDKLFDTFYACTWRKHLESTLVFAAETLRGYSDMELVSWNDFIMNDGWSVVCCIHTVYRILHNRLTQISICIALTHALVNGFFYETTCYVALLAHFDEHNSHSCVLTHRYSLGFSYVGILYYRANNFACQW